MTSYNDTLSGTTVTLVFNQLLWFGTSMRKYLIDTKQVLSHGIQRSDDPYHQNSILGIVNYESDWYIPFIVQQYFTGLETRTPIIEEYNDFPDVIYITSDKNGTLQIFRYHITCL